jgi:putative ABC transport system ATP-binding protein
MAAHCGQLHVALTPAVEARELYRFYHVGDDEVLALRGVSLAVLAGEMVAVMGPSGSGKSTLIACLTGLDNPDAGSVKIAGQRMTRQPESERAALRARSIGMLAQSRNLFTGLSVDQNVRLAMRLAGLDDARARAGVLEEVGLAQRRHALPHQLSGGEAARAGLAIALASNPALLVADEPTAEVDARTETWIINALRARRARGTAVVLATHSEPLARAADRVVMLRDGRVVE